MVEETGYLEGQGYQKWFAKLGVSDSPLTRAGLQTALKYLHRHMPDLNRRTMESFLKGIDLHKPVNVVFMPKDTGVAAFRRPTEDPFRLFYTKAGTSVRQLGVNPRNRSFQRYRVVHDVTVLESRAAGITDDWSVPGVGYCADGGGLQYIIPYSFLHLAIPVR